jgi:hypothetical protein
MTSLDYLVYSIIPQIEKHSSHNTRKIYSAAFPAHLTIVSRSKRYNAIFPTKKSTYVTICLLTYYPTLLENPCEQISRNMTDSTFHSDPKVSSPIIRNHIPVNVMIDHLAYPRQIVLLSAKRHSFPHDLPVIETGVYLSEHVSAPCFSAI